MEKRLKLAKNLLKRSGVLICTIDENEHATLGLLLQELFPNREIVGVVIIHNPAGVQGKNFSYVHEFAYFVYPKNGVHIGKTKRDKELVSPLRDWGGTSARKLAKTCFYPIIVKNNEIIGFGDVCPPDFHPKKANIKQKDGSTYIYPIDKNGIERKWVFSKSSAEEKKDELFCKKLNGDIVIMRRKNLFTYRTVWDDKRYYANIYGSKLLNNIISAKFPFPKSLYAVEDCIKAVIHNKNNSTILDFFAGSGTTGHAVLNLNNKDGGNRKFILCTNNEDNNGEGTKISDDICYPRIKKVIKGYIGVVDKKQYGGLGGNLKYFRTDFVDAEPTDRNKRKMVDKSTEMLCLKEDCFEEVKVGKEYKIFKNPKDKYLGIIYDDEGIEPFKKEVKKLKTQFSVYVFSLDESAREEEFEDVAESVELKPIPAVILNVYKRIFK
jgi:adenine-specific DNA-methyltransferase